jgi:hypothetical protein
VWSLAKLRAWDSLSNSSEGATIPKIRVPSGFITMPVQDSAITTKCLALSQADSSRGSTDSSSQQHFRLTNCSLLAHQPNRAARSSAPEIRLNHRIIAFMNHALNVDMLPRTDACFHLYLSLREGGVIHPGHLLSHFLYKNPGTSVPKRSGSSKPTQGEAGDRCASERGLPAVPTADHVRQTTLDGDAKRWCHPAMTRRRA